MNELSQEFKQKIANFDNNPEMNTQEKDVLFYVESYARDMPTAYLDKLIKAIQEKLKNKQLTKTQIWKECEDAINELNRDMKNKKDSAETMLEKIGRFGNIASELTVKNQLWFSPLDDLATHGFSDKWVHGYNKEEWNFVRTIPEFEGILRSTNDVRNINSKALGNYFQYLAGKWQLKPEILLRKIKPEILMQLSRLWDSGWNQAEGKDRLLAKEALIKNNSDYIITVIITLGKPGNFIDQLKTLNTTEEQNTAILLLKENYNASQANFKKYLKKEFLQKNPNMKDAELEKISTEILEKVMKHEGIKWLPEIYKIVEQYNKKYNINLDWKSTASHTHTSQEFRSKVKVAESLAAGRNEKDPKRQAEFKKEVKKEERKIQDVLMAEKTNKKMTIADIQDLQSWKKTIEQVVEEFKKEDKKFAQEYSLWEKEKTKSDNESPNKPPLKQDPTESTSEKTRTSSATIPFNKINNGEVYSALLTTTSTPSEMITITGDQNIFTIQLGGNPENTIKLPQEHVQPYLESLKFLETLGLGYFIQNLSQKELSHLLMLTGKNGELVNTCDGTFDVQEQQHIADSFARLLGIKGVENSSTIDDTTSAFQRFFFTQKTSIESILRTKDILKNGILNGASLEAHIKNI